MAAARDQFKESSDMQRAAIEARRTGRCRPSQHTDGRLNFEASARRHRGFIRCGETQQCGCVHAPGLPLYGGALAAASRAFRELAPQGPQLNMALSIFSSRHKARGCMHRPPLTVCHPGPHHPSAIRAAHTRPTHRLSTCHENTTLPPNCTTDVAAPPARNCGGPPARQLCSPSQENEKRSKRNLDLSVAQLPEWIRIGLDLDQMCLKSVASKSGPKSVETGHRWPNSDDEHTLLVRNKNRCMQAVRTMRLATCAADSKFENTCLVSLRRNRLPIYSHVLGQAV